MHRTVWTGARLLARVLIAPLTLLLVIPATIHARPQTVDSLSSPAGSESGLAIFARFLYTNFGPVGLGLSVILAVILIMTLRRKPRQSVDAPATTNENGQP